METRRCALIWKYNSYWYNNKKVKNQQWRLRFLKFTNFYNAFWGTVCQKNYGVRHSPKLRNPGHVAIWINCKSVIIFLKNNDLSSLSFSTLIKIERADVSHYLELTFFVAFLWSCGFNFYIYVCTICKMTFFFQKHSKWPPTTDPKINLDIQLNKLGKFTILYKHTQSFQAEKTYSNFP